MLDRIFKKKKLLEPTTDALQIGSRAVPLLMVHHPRARRYLLRLRSDGTVRVTIPRRGTISEARAFASRNIGWLERQFQRMAVEPKSPVTWNLGTEIRFRGELVRIEPDAGGWILFGSERVKVPDASADLKPAIQRHLRKLACAGTAGPGHGTGGPPRDKRVPGFGAESENSLGLVFTEGNHLAQLAVDPVTRFCA